MVNIRQTHHIKIISEQRIIASMKNLRIHRALTHKGKCSYKYDVAAAARLMLQDLRGCSCVLIPASCGHCSLIY